MRSFCVSAIASNQGKTILTTALLWHFRGDVRAYKIGPDFIDPQFHQKVTKTPSINLDSYIMNQKQVKWLYNHYADKPIGILEGVMGFYDGEDRGCSAYGVTKLLDIPTILVLDGSGSYITISAVLKGVLEYQKDNTIKAVVLNKLSSKMHYELIKKQLQRDHPQIKVLGWIEKNLPQLRDTHLGLELDDLDLISQISQMVLKHIDIDLLLSISTDKVCDDIPYPFAPIPKIDKTLAIVNDSNFSFLYHDNEMFLRNVFAKVIKIDATKDEPIPNDVDIVYIPGGYVESDSAYKRIKDSNHFKQSLITHAKTKPIYAECAGLLYLSKRVGDKKLAGILDAEFELGDRYKRLGYYYNQNGIKGHAFHYTYPTAQSLQKGYDILQKHPHSKGEVSSWKTHKSVGTYLHTMFRAYPIIISNYSEI